MLHGWGIVSGLGIRPTDSELTIEAGYALDRYGDEIVVAEAVTVDLLTGRRRRKRRGALPAT